MKRKAPLPLTKNERPCTLLSILTIVSVLLLLLPTSILSFSVGNELARTRTCSTKSTNSDVSTSSHWVATTFLSASRNWNNNHGLLDTSTSSPAAAAASSKDEQAVDEYLEFLDRRYRYVCERDIFYFVLVNHPNAHKHLFLSRMTL